MGLLVSLLLLATGSSAAMAQAADQTAGSAADLMAEAAAPASFAGVAGALPAPVALPESSVAEVALPDDPSAALDPAGTQRSAMQRRNQAERMASLHRKYIPAGWKVYPLTRHDKVLLGVRDLYNPLTLGTITVAAGYSHLVNGQPNFGTDRDAFAQRFGAAFARDSSQGLFTDALFAPLLHEDPRYYELGPDVGFFHRTLYAITRPLVTRTDSGATTVNGALLLGYASSSALTYVYYPQINRNPHDVAATFGGAIGGAALGDFVDEFSSDVFVALHLKHRD